MTSAAHLFQHYSNAPRYNTKAVVGETGVPSDTFRAWERRYRVPSPQRNHSGQRLYSERDIAIIRWLRDRTGEGMTISQAVILVHTTDMLPASPRVPRSCESLRRDLLQMLLHFDAPAADTLLNEAFNLFTFDNVCLDILQPALAEIGERWHTNHTTVAQEHFATQFLRRKLLAMLNMFDVAEGRATIVAACAPGESRDIGLQLVSLFLVRQFYKVINLGPDVSSTALQQAILQVQPQIACIASTTPSTAEAGWLAAQQLRTAAPGTIVVLDGPIHKHPDCAGVHYLHGDARTMAHQIETLLADRQIS